MRKWRSALPFITATFPPKLLEWAARAMPWRDMHHLIGLLDTMHTTAGQIWEEKKRLHVAGEKTNDTNDIMTILRESRPVPINCNIVDPPCSVKANLEASEGERLSDDEMLAQIW